MILGGTMLQSITNLPNELIPHNSTLNNSQTQVSTYMGSRNFSVSKNDSFSQGNLDNIVRINEMRDNKINLTPLNQLNSKEIAEALSKGKLGRIEITEDNEILIKTSEEHLKKLGSLGISSVEIDGANGIQTYTSFNFETLNDKELDLLITNVKAYIVFLQTIEAPKGDEKTEKQIKHHVSKLKHLQHEKTRRADNKQENKVAGQESLADANFYKVAKKMAELRNFLDSIIEKKEQAMEEKNLEDKHVRLLKQVLNNEVILNLIKLNLNNGKIISKSIEQNSNKLHFLAKLGL